MKLLITGGAGFIGSNFIRYFRREHPEDEILNLDFLTYAGNLENLSGLENDSKYTFVKGNICDRELIFDLVKDVDVIVHFAAESHVDRSIIDADKFVTTNVQGTLVLLDAAKEFGKRFHHVSTDEVFGALSLDDPAFNESTPYAPRNPYSASKAASDHLVRSYFHTHNLPITISNCSNNYGPYQFPEKIIPLFISRLNEGLKVPVYGTGQQIRDWIYVDDHCRGIDAILQNGQLGETYCLGGKDAEVTNMDLTRKLIELKGYDENRIEFVQDRPGHDRRYAMDFSKAKAELGWEPLVDLDSGLAKTIEWYGMNKEWVARCKSGEYQKYYDINYGGKIDEVSLDNQEQSSMKILIFGAGWIGSRCKEEWGEQAVLSDQYIKSKDDVLNEIRKHNPDVVLNAAGIVGKPNVDWCDEHPVETMQGNTILPMMIAEACAEENKYLLHIGTGCIFYGDSPHADKAWRESDVGNPEPAYTRSKMAADLALSTLPNVGIGRIRMPIDSKPFAGNLIDKIVSYDRVVDVENSVTILEDMISAFYQLMEKRAEGIFHVVNPGLMRHYDLVKLYQEFVDASHQCQWISEQDLVNEGLAKKKRSNNHMKSDNLVALGIQMRPIHEALRDTMEKYAKLK